MTSDRNLLDAIGVLRRRIPEGLLRFTYARSAGPGGQNVNKVNTRATLWFDVGGSEALHDHEKRRIRSKLGGRVTKQGHLHIVSLRHRTQRANRRAATERFYELLALALARPKARKPTQVSRAARQRRLADKRRHGQRKQERADRHRDNFDPV